MPVADNEQPVAREVIVRVSYRPLATLDELHVLLLEAVAVSAAEQHALAVLFSLPCGVVVRELSALEAYGLAWRSEDIWTATNRGFELIAVRAAFQGRADVEVRTTDREWLLGPGEFARDETVRDVAGIVARARSRGIADERAALAFLKERSLAAERFEAFVLDWSSRTPRDDARDGFGEAAVFDHLRFAETDEALRRLEGLLAARIDECADRATTDEAAGALSDGAGRSETAAAIRERGHGTMKSFRTSRREQLRRNSELARVKSICEWLVAARWAATALAGRWLTTNAAQVGRSLDAEPAAFVFKSTVPFPESCPKPKPAPSRTPIVPPSPVPSPGPSPSARAGPKPREHGLFRSLLRWLRG